MKDFVSINMQYFYEKKKGFVERSDNVTRFNNALVDIVDLCENPVD
jgi:hypothetical protein